MQHINPELLQRFLAGATDPVERETVETHLAECSACNDLLLELAADDAFLADSLALTLEETKWIQSQDITKQVIRQIAPRWSVNPVLAIAALASLPGIWILNLLGSIVGGWVASQDAVNLIIDIGGNVLPAFGRFLIWMSEGGLLAQLWPLFILGAAFWFWRLSHTKETNGYA